MSDLYDAALDGPYPLRPTPDRKSTRLNSSHRCISYAVFCLKKNGTEQKIEQALRRLLHGRPAVIIAHRLSTSRDADLIIVLEHGRVFFFFNDTAPPEIYTLSLPDALPIWQQRMKMIRQAESRGLAMRTAPFHSSQ